MGDPRRNRKKYSTPRHPWERQRMAAEAEVFTKYGLKNKTELWKSNSLLKSFKDQAKKLSSLRTKQADREKELLLKRLFGLGLIGSDATLEAVLTLGLDDILSRRLQSAIVKRGLARSMRQARQFISHGHIKVKENVVTAPSYILKRGEEEALSFSQSSALSNAEHPERAVKTGEQK